MNGIKGTNDNAASNTLAKLSESLFNIWSPVQQQGAKTAKDLFKTGGSNTTTPIIQQLIQSLRSGLSRTMVDTQGRLGMARQAGTPFGQRILAETQREGQSEIAGAGPDMAMKMLSLLIPMGTGGTGTSIGGLGSSANANASVLDSQNSAYANIMSAMMPKTSIGYSGEGGGCWIAEALYGPQAVETWLARWWVNFIAPPYITAIYLRYGRWVARQPWLCFLLRPVFAWIVARARQEFSR